MSNLYEEDEISYPSELLEFMDALNYLLSSRFVEKWRYKYSEPFIITFQSKIVESLRNSKPVKKDSLRNVLKNQTKFNLETIDEFYLDIDVSLYYPAIL